MRSGFKVGRGVSQVFRSREMAVWRDITYHGPNHTIKSGVLDVHGTRRRPLVSVGVIDSLTGTSYQLGLATSRMEWVASLNLLIRSRVNRRQRMTAED